MKREQLKNYFRKQYSLLAEQDEEDPFATDDAAADEEPDEEAADEEAADDTGEEDEGEGEGEGEDEVEVDEDDEQRFQKSIDDQLQALLIDIEADSIKSAVVQQESYSLKQMYINESGDVPIDTDKFASEVARLILNFDAFLDLETMLLSKVRSFLVDKHGEEAADEVEKLLSDRHDLKRREEVEEADDIEEQVPIAVGATPGAGV
jgi:hypothetical protein